MRITGGGGEATLAGRTKTVVAALDEAATIDGCSRLGVLIRITLPSPRRGSWRSSSTPSSPHGPRSSLRPVLAQDYRVKTLPVAILFFAKQRLFVGGLTTGRVKG